jgi:hypothetical protein
MIIQNVSKKRYFMGNVVIFDSHVSSRVSGQKFGKFYYEIKIWSNQEKEFIFWRIGYNLNKKNEIWNSMF